MKKCNKIKFYPFENIHKELMKRPGYRQAHEDSQFEFSLIRSIIMARAKQGLTQRDLAKRIGVAQSTLARFETGQSNPTLTFFKKLVKGLGLKMAIF